MLLKVFLMLLVPMLSLEQVQSSNKSKPDSSFKDISNLPQLQGNDVSLQGSVAEVIHPVVKTTSGLLSGITTEAGHAFYSVKFAKAPTGNLRFKDPEPYTGKGHEDVSKPDYRQCYQYSKKCSSDYECRDKFKMTEDCLVLNVFVPPFVNFTNLPTKKLPVMVWIHGGAFYFGSGTDPVYDGTSLSASTGTIIVAINYRLDAFGFLYYKTKKETIDGLQGIKDQRLALTWVQSNIEHFGGDKSKVTLFGESAGAQSVMIHLLSSHSKSLFKRAIMQSNPAAFFFPKRNDATKTTKRLIRGISLICLITPLKCLREAPAFELMKLHSKQISIFNPYQMIEPYRPVLENDGILQQPLEAFKAGKWQKEKEVIIGVTKEEFAAFLPILLKKDHITVTQLQFKVAIILAVGEKFNDQVANEYLKHTKNRANLTNLLIEEATDQYFACATRQLARSMYRTSTHKNIFFYVDYHPITGTLCETMVPCGYAMHGSDVIFLFNGGSTGIELSKDDENVAKMFSKFWGNFAHYGTPSNNTKEWPPYLSTSVNNVQPWPNMKLEAAGANVESDYRKDKCDFWDKLHYYENHKI